MPSDIGAHCARAEALCQAIAPLDLAGLPVYVVPQSAVPAELGGRSVCYGFTSPSLDLYLKDVIGTGWRGRGPCMVLDDSDFGRLDAIDVEQAVLSTVLHELAHVLDRPWVYRERRDPVRVQFEALCLGQAVAAEPVLPVATPPFAGHEDRFIRAALHLQYRASQRGAVVAPSRLCAGRQYDLSHASRYRDALGDEPRRLAAVSIRELLGSPVPEAFSRLWAADVARWRSSCSPVEERIPSMSIATLLEKIAGRQQKRQAARQADFREVVRQIVDGGEPSPEVVDRVLGEAGKSLADLEAAVELLQKRRALCEQYDRLTALAIERRQVGEQIEAANEALDEAEERHAATTAPLVVRLQEIRDAVWAGESARRELWASCDDPDLLAEQAEVQGQLDDARQQAQALRATLDEWRARAKAERDSAARAKRILDNEERVKEHLAAVRQYEGQVREAVADLAKAEKRVAVLEGREASVREKMLVP